MGAEEFCGHHVHARRPKEDTEIVRRAVSDIFTFHPPSLATDLGRDLVVE